jgi:hypothetical protein
MVVLADKCQRSFLEKISLYLNWEYVLPLIELTTEEEWLYYIKLIHENSLTPEQLREKIVEGVFESEKVLPLYPWLPLFGLSQAKVFRDHTVEWCFGKDYAESFRSLFEFQNVQEIGSVEFAIFYDSIQHFQVECNYVMNAQFNNLSWGIGEEITRLSHLFNVPVSEEVIADLADGLDPDFKPFFDQQQLKVCLRFASQFPAIHEHAALLPASGNIQQEEVSKNKSIIVEHVELEIPEDNKHNINSNIFKNQSLLDFLKLSASK